MNWITFVHVFFCVSQQDEHGPAVVPRSRHDNDLSPEVLDLGAVSIPSDCDSVNKLENLEHNIAQSGREKQTTTEEDNHIAVNIVPKLDEDVLCNSFGRQREEGSPACNPTVGETKESVQPDRNQPEDGMRVVFESKGAVLSGRFSSNNSH